MFKLRAHGFSDAWRMARPAATVLIWGFPKIRGTLFWGPYDKDPSI